MTELSALAGSEGYAACDDEAKDMQLATTTGSFLIQSCLFMSYIWSKRMKMVAHWARVAVP